MSQIRSAKGLPSHTQLSEFIASLLPVHPTDVPFTYHTPRGRHYDPSHAPVSSIVLSITPTPGVYQALNEVARSERRKPACFLHRPFGLDRRAVPWGTIIWASHKRFDERLTVGYNVQLAQALHLDPKDHIDIRGYKGDPDRLIGLVALLQEETSLQDMKKNIIRQFQTCELYPIEADPQRKIKVVAIMNAFNPDVMSRVIEAVSQRGWTDVAATDGSVLYLTGEARDTGLQAASESNMAVACVGHRPAEEWGIRWLAQQLRQQYSQLQVIEIFEDEEPQTTSNGNDSSSQRIDSRGHEAQRM